VVTEVAGLVGGIEHRSGNVEMPAGESRLGQERHRQPVATAETSGCIGESVSS
jgi:hypothetical protein